MIRFFYDARYDTPVLSGSRFELHMRVYLLADKYVLGQLLDYAKSHIATLLRTDLDYSKTGETFASKVKAIYTETRDDDGRLKAVAVQVTEPKAEKFFAEEKRARAIAEAAPGFMAALIQELAKHGAPPDEETPGLPIYRCPQCKANFRSKMKTAGGRAFSHECKHQISEKEWQSHRV